MGEGKKEIEVYVNVYKRRVCTHEGVSKLKICGLKAQISPSPGQRPG